MCEPVAITLGVLALAGAAEGKKEYDSQMKAQRKAQERADREAREAEREAERKARLAKLDPARKAVVNAAEGIKGLSAQGMARARARTGLSGAPRATGLQLRS